MTNEKNLTIVIVILVAVILVLAGMLFGAGKKQVPADSGGNSGQIIGGEKDEHGCLGPAGYSWCQAKQKCLRVWEEPCEDKAAPQQTCGVENCHGLDIQCGTNPPGACTMMYQVGDKCLKYAKCEIKNGQCQQTINPQFEQCKACAEKCESISKNDSVKVFECEAACN